MVEPTIDSQHMMHPSRMQNLVDESAAQAEGLSDTPRHKSKKREEKPAAFFTYQNGKSKINPRTGQKQSRPVARKGKRKDKRKLQAEVEEMGRAHVRANARKNTEEIGEEDKVMTDTPSIEVTTTSAENHQTESVVFFPFQNGESTINSHAIRKQSQTATKKAKRKEKRKRLAGIKKASRAYGGTIEQEKIEEAWEEDEVMRDAPVAEVLRGVGCLKIGLSFSL